MGRRGARPKAWAGVTPLARGKESGLVRDQRSDRSGPLGGDDGLREGVLVGPRPRMTFDRDRWTAGTVGRAAEPRRRARPLWMAGAAAVAAVAVTAPAWLHTLHVQGPRQPSVVAPVPATARGHVGIEQVWMTSAAHGWAMGAPGVIWSTTDGGRRWQNVSPPHAPAPGALVVRSFRDAWWAAANRQGVRIYRTQNAGRTWASTELPGPAFPAGWRLSQHALALGRPGTAYLLVAPNWYGKAGSPPATPDTLWVTHDGGMRWTRRVLSGFTGGVEDAGRLYPGPGGTLLLESAGHHQVWRSSDGGRHWTAVRVRGAGAGARLVGHPMFFGEGAGASGLWLAATGASGAPVSQDTTDVLVSSTGGASWISTMTVQGFSPVLAALSPTSWAGVANDPARSGTTGPAGQYFDSGTHQGAIAQWSETLVPHLPSAARIQQLDFLDRQNQWVLVDVGGTNELWASTDGGRTWSDVSSGTNPQAP